MNTRFTKILATLTFGLAMLWGLTFIGTAVSHLTDDGAVCVQTGFWANATLEGGLPVGEGVDASSSEARFCQNDPSAAQRAADLGGRLPWMLFASVALVLFSRVLDAVVSEGPFTDEMARRLTVLGWFVTVGTPVAGLVVGWSQSWLAASMAPMLDAGPAISEPQVLILAGLAAVIMGKIMRQGVRMREDLEGTI
ncbi:DUF2975 domain-containing protein [Streptomyces sp. NBC_01264]|uniref:DUF2975 domain-containing protein n=1 Tax=Streptomyces sp. NBC_01264 TaxID=2903804 RepID=UPI0022572F14|nr:DUF2975 domain-containing protein [Streptomyces sp. NBC_01264]MCX4777680.1 DUF2975 domain-containing protein [Streptomyces sp. NBC_01264]